MERSRPPNGGATTGDVSLLESHLRQLNVDGAVAIDLAMRQLSQLRRPDQFEDFVSSPLLRTLRASARTTQEILARSAAFPVGADETMRLATAFVTQESDLEIEIRQVAQVRFGRWSQSITLVRFYDWGQIHALSGAVGSLAIPAETVTVFNFDQMMRETRRIDPLPLMEQAGSLTGKLIQLGISGPELGHWLEVILAKFVKSRVVYPAPVGSPWHLGAEAVFSALLKGKRDADFSDLYAILRAAAGGRIDSPARKLITGFILRGDFKSRLSPNIKFGDLLDLARTLAVLVRDDNKFRYRFPGEGLGDLSEMDQLFVDFVSHAVQVGAIDAKEKFEEFWRVLTGGLAHVEKLPPFTALAAKNLAEGLPSQPGSGSGTNGNSSRPAWWPFCLKIYP